MSFFFPPLHGLSSKYSNKFYPECRGIRSFKTLTPICQNTQYHILGVLNPNSYTLLFFSSVNWKSHCNLPMNLDERFETSPPRQEGLRSPVILCSVDRYLTIEERRTNLYGWVFVCSCLHISFYWVLPVHFQSQVAIVSKQKGM
jgi:hypothetical protein